MASGRQSDRFSMEPDNTLRDIWQFSQDPDSRFDPQTIDSAVGYRKTLRIDDRFSFGALDGDSPVPREKELSRAMKRRSANINLQRSIQMLDDAVVTPSSHLQSARKTPSLLRHSKYTPQSVPGENKMDASSTIGGLSKSRYTPGGAASTVAGQADSISVEERNNDLATTNVSRLIEESPETSDCIGLFKDFMDAMRDNVSQHQVVNLVAVYEEMCCDNVELLKKITKRCVPGQGLFHKTVQLMNQLKLEKNTWRLVNSLFKDRLASDIKSDEEPMLVDSLGKRMSEKQIVERLYERDSEVRQAQLVIDWLEHNAADDLDDYYDRLEFFAEPNSAKENTAHVLKQQQIGNMARPEGRLLVDQIDPDAPLRQKRPLAELDVEDEHRLLKYLFALIRAGQFQEAQKLCTHFGEPWRAATLSGWRLYHDSNYDSPSSHKAKVEGNSHRDIWKSVCWRMAEDRNVSAHEKAIYGTFCGNLGQLLPICDTWEDYLWSYMRVLVDQRVENELRLTYTASRATKPLPATYWEKLLATDNVFQDIQASPADRIRHEGMQRVRLIQKYIILGDTDGLIEELFEWVKDESNRLPSHTLRFFAHLVLLFRFIGATVKEELCVSVIEAYIKVLIEEKQIELVATYVATLPQELQVEWYAKFLTEVYETATRQRCLQLAAECGLDVARITKLVVEMMRSRDAGDLRMEGDLPSESATTTEDRVKIDALDWLTFDRAQRSEAMKQINALVRTFLSLRKLAAAKEALQKLPPDSIDSIYKLWRSQTGENELCAEDANAIREYLCAQSYVLAHDSFNDWFEHYHNAKPARPDLPPGANFTEKVAYEHREKQYEAEMERWRHSLSLQSGTTEEKIYNVLLFVDGGWMVDQRLEGARDENRTHQMRLLRQLCLPTMCFLLHTVLHTTAQYKKCLQLADVLASEQHQLYKTFRKDELQKFLHKLKDSSLCLLDDNSDPLGYEV